MYIYPSYFQKANYKVKTKYFNLKKSKMKPFKLILLLLLLQTSFFSCKKEEKLEGENCGLPSEMYRIAQNYYLWNYNLPSSIGFKPCTYNENGVDLANKIRTYSPFQNGKFNDRFTFIIKKQIWDNVVEGKNLDSGMGLAFQDDNDFRVAYCYSASASGQLGIKRGWKVISINDIKATKQNEVILNLELAKNERIFKFQKPDSSLVSHNIQSNTYIQDYIINPKIFNQNGKNIGYFMFDSFLGDGEAGQSTIDKLKTIFADFSSKNVNELIIDLRYNGGGYGNVAYNLANLIAPATAQGKLFVESQHNEKLASNNKKLFFTNSLNGLKLKRVIFIVSKNTASASEELINGLKPIMEVKLIGTPTYGKPVGFYRIPVLDYYFFPVAVKNVNLAGFSDFFDGFQPDKLQKDDITHDFGDPNEACVANALEFFKTGKLARTGNLRTSNIPQKTTFLTPIKPSVLIMN